jgi:hypothetical protein
MTYRILVPRVKHRGKFAPRPEPQPMSTAVQLITHCRHPRPSSTKGSRQRYPPATRKSVSRRPLDAFSATREVSARINRTIGTES